MDNKVDPTSVYMAEVSPCPPQIDNQTEQPQQTDCSQSTEDITAKDQCLHQDPANEVSSTEHAVKSLPSSAGEAYESTII